MSETEFVKCTKCVGVGSYMGMGMLMKDCHFCDKVGYVKQTVKDDIDYLMDQTNVSPLAAPKKRGRKKSNEV